VLTPDGGITLKRDSGDAYAIFAAEVARSAIELFVGDDTRLSI
jgi:hypothetical protein